MEDHAAAAEHMDSIYRVQRHFYDLTRKYYLLGRDRLINELRPPAGGNVLELGCGTGRNLVTAARRYPEVRFHGVDISSMMLETAAAKVAAAALANRITLSPGDASTWSPPAGSAVSQFDRVMIPYALSMIPPWRETITNAIRLLSTGGSLHIVDFGSQERLPAAFKSGLHAWLRKFSVEPREDIETVLRAIAARDGLALRFERPFRGYAVYAVLARR